MKNGLWFLAGLFVGFSALSLSLGSVPKNVTDDTALYQSLSEIKVAPEKERNFEKDVSRLSRAEGRYKERLPLANRPMRKKVIKN